MTAVPQELTLRESKTVQQMANAMTVLGAVNMKIALEQVEPINPYSRRRAWKTTSSAARELADLLEAYADICDVYANEVIEGEDAG